MDTTETRESIQYEIRKIAAFIQLLGLEIWQECMDDSDRINIDSSIRDRLVSVKHDLVRIQLDMENV